MPGTNAPTIAIGSPVPYTRFTNQVVTITGTATDDSELARVAYRVNGGAQQIAAGTTNWSIPLAPNIGLTTVSVESIDFEGRRSTTNSVTFSYTAWVPLNLLVLGDGRVTGVSNGQRIELGREYVTVAKPGKKQILETWSGSVTSRAATLAFLVPTNATNFSLTAQFAADPFIRLAGTYHGIIRSNTPALENSGLVTLSLSTKGGLSGRIRHRTGTYSFTGKLDTNYSTTLQGNIGGINRSISLKLEPVQAGRQWVRHWQGRPKRVAEHLRHAGQRHGVQDHREADAAESLAAVLLAATRALGLPRLAGPDHQPDIKLRWRDAVDCHG